MIRRALRLAGWPLLVALPLLANLHLVRAGWNLNLAFITTLGASCAVIFALERLAPRVEAWLDADGQTPNDLLFTLTTNVLVTPLVSRAIEVLLLVLVVGLVAPAASRPWVLWPAHWPPAAQFGLALTILEFTRYWGHRLSHTNGFLWQFHGLHHSPGRLSVLNLGRIHPAELLPLLLGVIAAVLLPIPKELVYWQAVFGMYVAAVAHSNLDLRTGPLDYVFNTPNLHRWHHSDKLHECMCNYCHALCLFDLVFGTYRNAHGALPARLGVPMPFPTGIRAQLAYPFVSRRKGRVIGTDPQRLAAAAPRRARGGAHTVELAGGARVSVPGGRPILGAFSAAGVRYPASCRMGECGTCKTVLVAGSVRIGTHCASALSPAQADAGVFLACCSTPLSDCVVAYGKPLKDTLRELERRSLETSA